MDHINIDMPDQASAESLAAAIVKAGGMEHPERKGVMSVAAQPSHALCVRPGVSPGMWIGVGDTVVKNQVLVSFPPPKPDIPALVEAWHRDPTPGTRGELWDALNALEGSDFVLKNGAHYKAAPSRSRIIVG